MFIVDNPRKISRGKSDLIYLENGRLQIPQFSEVNLWVFKKFLREKQEKISDLNAHLTF